KTAAEKLSKASAFNVFSVSSNDEAVVKASVNGTPASGSFSVEVLSLARAQTRSSGSFASSTDALGFSGDLAINGKAVAVSSSDSLLDLRDAINNASAGVQAQILQVSDTDHRLLLSSSTSGAKGFSLLDASTSNVLQSLGFTGTATSIKNSVSGGAQTDQFASSTSAVGSLLGLSSSLSGNVTIGDQTVAIDLSTQSLTDIKAAIDAAAPAGVTTSVVSEEVDGITQFRLQIDGTTTFVDDSNVLEALGVLQGLAEVSPAVAEVHTGNVANTTNGSTPVDANNRFNEIFGASVANGDTITISGTQRDGTAVSGSYTVSNVNSDRIQDLLTEIESVFGNEVSASIDSAGKLVVTDDTTGESQLSVAIQPNNEGGGSLSFGSISVTTEGQAATSREVVSGQDATFRVNGVTLTRSSNTVTDAVEGMALELRKASPGSAATVSSAKDTATIRTSIEDLVSSYNETMGLISDQFVFNEDAQASGPLSGDATLLTLQSQLRSLVSNPVSGLAANENSLTLLGVSFTRTGDLSIDSDKLDSTLNNNLSALQRIFVAAGNTSDSDIEFVFQNENTKAGSYDIAVTTAAEQASIEGSVDLSSGLANDEALTITDLATSRSTSIDLLTGEDTDTLVSKINSVLSSSVSEVRTGSVANTETGGVIPITAATTFDQIEGAGVLANDTIDIQGTLHSGERVSGSFTLSDPTTQTMGDLLAEIRSVFQSSVSTTIDANGQIVVTDNEVGNSELTVVLIERKEGGGSLDFGSIDVSTEGRFGMGITATNEAGKLKLSAKAYGASVGFTVSQSNSGVDTGIVDGSYNGVDVAGTINGEAATGKGRILSGSTSSSSVSGLSLRVLITPSQLSIQGSDQGTVKVTQGVGEQLDRALKSITDPFEGLIATREKAIQDTIASSQNQIDKMEVRLTLMQDTLLKQFTAMEVAVAELNSMGSFLNSQLASISAS
ncbi:MAG: flagellar filament capping protein FliD, partial [bacterium]|nr:flagellar filament capping protein FliD [bacterium]